MKKIILILILLLTAGGARAAVIGSTSDPSLNAFGARPIGMGKAYLGISDDGNGIFTNPAGLGYAKYLQITASNTTILQEIKNTTAALAYPTEWGTFGLGIVNVSLGGSYATIRDPSQSGRIITNPSGEAVSYENSVLLLSYSYKLPWNLSLGGNYKFFNQYLSGTGINLGKAAGSNLDLGVLYKPLYWVNLGAVMQNALSQSLKWETTGVEEQIGGYTKAGISARFLGPGALISHEAHQLIGAVDYFLPGSTLLLPNSSSSLQIGLEYTLFKTLSFRLGADNSSLTYGLGLEQSSFRFDYAFKPTPGVDGYDTHYFTLSYIGTPPPPAPQPTPKIQALPARVIITSPSNESVTTAESIKLSAEAKYVQQLVGFRINNLETIHTTTESFEILEILKPGKNIFVVEALSASPEGVAAKAELQVLQPQVFADQVQESARVLSSVGVIKGFPDGKFHPEKGLTRGQLVTLLIRTQGPQVATPESAQFKDLPAQHWAAAYILAAVNQKLVQGYPDGTFKPEKVLSRTEGIAVIARFARLESATLEAGYSPFKDLPEGFWANGIIESAKRAGFIDYLKDQDFEPKADFTRGEAAEILTRTPQIKGKIEDFWKE